MKHFLFIGLLTITSLTATAEEKQAQTLVGKFARVSCVPAESLMPDEIIISKGPADKGIDYRIIDSKKPQELFEHFYLETKKDSKSEFGASYGSLGVSTDMNEVTETSAKKRSDATMIGLVGIVTNKYGSEYNLDEKNKNHLIIKHYSVGHSLFPFSDVPNKETECLYSRQEETVNEN
jgi:hypothetical protein